MLLRPYNIVCWARVKSVVLHNLTLSSNLPWPCKYRESIHVSIFIKLIWSPHMEILLSWYYQILSTAGKSGVLMFANLAVLCLIVAYHNLASPVIIKIKSSYLLISCKMCVFPSSHWCWEGALLQLSLVFLKKSGLK